ncbi:MAG: hypothetical protein ACOCXH_16100 [Cyclobacteriaceae bacterium]
MQKSNKLFISFILIVVSLFNSCEKLNDEITLKKEPYQGSNLKINGYYYRYITDSSKVSPLFLYRNGVAITEFAQINKNKLEEKIKTGEYYNLIKDDPTDWGLYIVEDDNIKIEHLIGRGCIKLYSYLYIGTILNDTTILFTEHNASEGSDDNKCNNLYHFKKFSPKPDSTNQFVK